MNEASVIRLLFRGLPPAGNSGGPSALPFSPEEAAASPLCPPPADTPWKEGGTGGIFWLERAEPGLPGPLYITGAATSTLDAARVLLVAAVAEIQARHILNIKGKLNKILSENTGKPLEVIEKDTDRDNFMSPEEAKEYGLIDNIFKSRKAN